MKKAFYLTAVLLVPMLIFLSCQKSTDLLEPQTADENKVNNLTKKPVKPPSPPNDDPVIHSFSIGEKFVIQDNEVLDENFEIDLSSGSTFSFDVSHGSDPIKFVLVRLYSDLNNDNFYSWGYETVADAKRWEFLVPNTHQAVTNEEWSGTVTPIDYDPIDSEPYELYDQLLTGTGLPDHYKMTFTVQCEDRSHFSSKSVFLWIKAARGPDRTFHVANIHFTGLEDAGKNKVRPIFEVTVNDDQTNTGTVGATVFAQFTGIAESAFPTPHNDILTMEDGVAIIKGPTMSKKTKGDLIMTIKNVRTEAYGAYNPGAPGNISQKIITFPQ